MYLFYHVFQKFRGMILFSNIFVLIFTKLKNANNNLDSIFMQFLYNFYTIFIQFYQNFFQIKNTRQHVNCDTEELDTVNYICNNSGKHFF